MILELLDLILQWCMEVFLIQEMWPFWISWNSLVDTIIICTGYISGNMVTNYHWSKNSVNNSTFLGSILTSAWRLSLLDGSSLVYHRNSFLSSYFFSISFYEDILLLSGFLSSLQEPFVSISNLSHFLILTFSSGFWTLYSISNLVLCS